ncbi:hypothetical protein CA13_18930 [Planctomycetes bacterium CA13]|uniref:Uncharacterized protein n=1 Tax=Novipirellula herctigrandis TaxID=2527986 RepID=A0A5C5YZL0_9BACT|nr:hypothetical protein CA13_18930 [Planctomycetes bacterium CA13]
MQMQPYTSDEALAVQLEGLRRMSPTERVMNLSDTDDLVLALGPVARLLQTLGVRFYIGGSVASSFHGAVRSTMNPFRSRGGIIR